MDKLAKLNEKNLRLLIKVPKDKLKILLKFYRIDRNGKIGAEFLSKTPYLALTACIYLIAGQTTMFSLIGLENIFSLLDIFDISSYTVGIAGFLFGLFHYKSKRKTIAGMSKQIKELELLIDPSRKSSNLTQVGDTNEEDK